MTHTRCLIIGSGPAGYTAGIYTGRADLKPLLYEGLQPGGQLTITTEIENFPGYPEGISGTAMMEDLRKQALRFGTEIRKGTIEKIDLSHRPFVATDDKGEQRLCHLRRFLLQEPRCRRGWRWRHRLRRGCLPRHPLPQGLPDCTPRRTSRLQSNATPRPQQPQNRGAVEQCH